MKINNVEIKARCADAQQIRDILLSQGASYTGRDHQTDIYYRTAHGRLKLRLGNIENALIAYHRANTHDAKLSEVELYQTNDAPGLQAVLDRALDTQIVVDKSRDIYFIGNIKFHVDDVKGLGSFAEIEAIDDTGTRDTEYLKSQVTQYMRLLGIRQEDLLSHSYSDMILSRP